MINNSKQTLISKIITTKLNHILRLIKSSPCKRQTGLSKRKNCIIKWMQNKNKILTIELKIQVLSNVLQRWLELQLGYRKMRCHLLPYRSEKITYFRLIIKIKAPKNVILKIHKIHLWKNCKQILSKHHVSS
jgi:hypothetical protein